MFKKAGSNKKSNDLIPPIAPKDDEDSFKRNTEVFQDKSIGHGQTIMNKMLNKHAKGKLTNEDMKSGKTINKIIDDNKNDK